MQAHYGWDHVLGFFVEVRGPNRYKETHDALSPRYQRERPLQSVLEFLAEKGFYSIDDLQETLEWLADDPEGMQRRLRRVAEVIGNFKDAAG